MQKNLYYFWNSIYDCVVFIIKELRLDIQKSKNISYKMLKDVGMTVPKSRETDEVYIYTTVAH